MTYNKIDLSIALAHVPSPELVALADLAERNTLERSYLQYCTNQTGPMAIYDRGTSAFEIDLLR